MEEKVTEFDAESKLAGFGGDEGRVLDGVGSPFDLVVVELKEPEPGLAGLDAALGSAFIVD
jgi:hypothetical protein